MRVRISRKTRRRLLAVATFGLSVLLVAGCVSQTKATEPWNDAPRKGAVITEPVEVVANADGFSNFSTGCNHGNRWYVLFHGDTPYGGIAVVANDASCKGKP